MPTPRPHYKERIAHAEGYEIEYLDANGKWLSDPDPNWYPDWQYRVKPEPKPDVVRSAKVELYGTWVRLSVPLLGNDDNINFIFDCETGKLKAAEVIGG